MDLVGVLFNGCPCVNIAIAAFFAYLGEDPGLFYSFYAGVKYSNHLFIGIAAGFLQALKERYKLLGLLADDLIFLCYLGQLSFLGLVCCLAKSFEFCLYYRMKSFVDVLFFSGVLVIPSLSFALVYISCSRYGIWFICSY